MAISRITTWSAGQVLTASAVNAEYNNILDNALALISPLTGNLAAGGNNITGLGRITSVSNANLFIEADGTGAVQITDLAFGNVLWLQVFN